jgi:hypothetical protein
VRSEKNSIFLIIFVSLIAATAVSAAPTITFCDNSTMAAIGTDILIPPAEFTGSPSAGAGTFHPNATVFIVLTGFLCISLIIDRKLWRASLTAPLRPGQSGFHSIPQLAGTLAGTITFPSYISMHDKIRQKHNIQHAISFTNAVLKFAITHFSSLHKPALICMALSYEQNKSFSPAFIFVRLARGPPILT